MGCCLLPSNGHANTEGLLLLALGLFVLTGNRSVSNHAGEHQLFVLAFAGEYQAS